MVGVAPVQFNKDGEREAFVFFLSHEWDAKVAVDHKSVTFDAN